jgi:hypothetical protein
MPPPRKVGTLNILIALLMLGCSSVFAQTGSISGARTACKYNQFEDNFYTYTASRCATDWYVLGGEIVDQGSNSVTIRWTSAGTKGLLQFVKLVGLYKQVLM